MAQPKLTFVGASLQPEAFTIRSIAGPLTAIALGLFMAILDNVVVNVALPTLVRDYKSDLQLLQWVVTAYMLAQAAVIPLAGWLADRFGSKRIFLYALGLFVLGSALCAAAPTTGLLITFRVLQGLGGGCLMPIGMAYAFRLSPPARRGMVMSTLGIPIIVAYAAGPALSGWLVEYMDWRWIFLINVPIGACTLLVGLRELPAVPTQAMEGARWVPDPHGMVLGPLAFAALSYGMSEGGSGWRSLPSVGGLTVGTIALLAFMVVELRASQPLLELRVFKAREFSLACVTRCIGLVGLQSGLFLPPLFFQQVRGYGALDTGLSVLPQALGAAVMMPAGGRLYDRFGVRPLALVGLTLIALPTFLLAHVSVTTTGTALAVPLLIRGVGLGLTIMPLNTHLLSTAPPMLLNRVSALTNALQYVVSALTIAGLATILQARALAHGMHSFMSPAYAAAFDDTLLVVAVVCGAGALLGLLLRPGHPTAPPQRVEAPALATGAAG